VAAIFTAGADSSFQDLPSELNERCLSDVSAQMGRFVSNICLDDAGNLTYTSDGPYLDIGGIQLSGGGLASRVAPSAFQNGLTLSFWARGILPGVTILSIGKSLSVVYRSEGDVNGVFLEESIGNDVRTAQLDLSNTGVTADDWLWLSFELHKDWTRADFNVFSSGGTLLGQVSLEDLLLQSYQDSPSALLNMFVPEVRLGGSGQEDEVEMSPEGNTAFVRQGRRAGEDNRRPHADISFVMIHKATLLTEEIGELRHQIRRYDRSL
jgi:hypothetical protein